MTRIEATPRSLELERVAGEGVLAGVPLRTRRTRGARWLRDRRARQEGEPSRAVTPTG